MCQVLLTEQPCGGGYREGRSFHQGTGKSEGEGIRQRRREARQGTWEGRGEGETMKEDVVSEIRNNLGGSG